MQSSFRRNLILISEAVLAFILLQLFQFLFGISNPLLLGLVIVSLSLVFFLTTCLFVKRRERKTKALGLNVQAELAG